MKIHGARLFQLFLFGTLLSAATSAAPATSSITLATSANPSFLGKALTLTATVTPSSATGDVTFYDGVVPLGVARLSGANATLSTLALAPGAHTLSALYRGDSLTQPGASAPIQQTVLGLGQNGFQKQAAYPGVINPFALAAGDFRGNGKLDLVVGNVGSDTIAVLPGNGDGTFGQPANFAVDPATFSSPSGIAVGDFNGDGHMDIAAANAASAVSTVAVLLGNGDGTFKKEVSYPVPGNPHSLNACDFNGDGISDLVTDNFGHNSISVLLGKADGTFQAPLNATVGTGPINTTCGDFNGDGKADVAVVYQTVVSVLLGKGDGTFQAPASYAVGKGANWVTAGDLNRDGHADLAVVNTADNNVSILLGKGDGTFAAAVNYSTGAGPFEVVAGDFDGDGLTDLAVTNSTDNNVGVLLGKGDGTFQSIVNYAAGSGPRPLVAADFNSDGRSDLVAGNYLGGTVSVLLGVAVDRPIVTAVVNGASFASTGLSPGLIFTLGGIGLGPSTGQGLQLDSKGRIASSLSQVQVLVDGTPAPLLYVSQNQINAVAPYELTSRVGQNVNVQVVINQLTSNLVAVPIKAVSPAIFSLGNGQGAIRNQDQSINGPSNPAAVGSFLSIYATGEGQIKPGGVDGQLVTDASTIPLAAVALSIGGVPVTPQFAGSTAFDGFFQVNAQVPSGLSGAVPVALTVGGVTSPSGINVVVQ